MKIKKLKYKIIRIRSNILRRKLSSKKGFMKLIEKDKLAIVSDEPISISDFGEEVAWRIYINVIEFPIIDFIIDNEYTNTVYLDTFNGHKCINFGHTTLTESGEEYLKKRGFFAEHPFLEKVLLIAVTALVSTLTTFAVQHFFK